MQVVRSIAEMKKLRRQCKGSVGLVPTMGYLHEGHLELSRRAKSENPVAVATIFVNPTQFGPGEDLKSYPRNLERDLELLDKVKTDMVFVPSDKEMYPGGYDTWVEVKGITAKLEGKSRPTHFQGVTTVCNKLFNIVEPDKAYFGQKDAQQAIVIQRMVSDLNMNLEIVVCPTVRESDGLAMSSRNTYLTAEERPSAVVLYKSLCLAKDMYDRGERDAAAIKKAMNGLISGVSAAKIDYISIADTGTLDEVEIIKGKVLISLAVRLGKPRLIDNIILG
ncbi:MAG: pantoate--beta-alanine ligase [Dehalococcoidia bacterium]|nr:pantoate--beta-alanine ligase [Dehalococcoidia bacterium]